VSGDFLTASFLQIPVADVFDPRVGFAFGAGLVTFLAPCAFPLLPGYVAYFLGTDDGPGSASTTGRLRRAVVVGGVTSVGFFTVYAILVGTVAVVGTGPLQNISVLELVVGTFLIVLGASMLTGRFDPASLHLQLPERRRGVAGYFVFGVVYAAAAAGCTAPVFIGLSLSALTAGPVTAAAIFVVYAATMSGFMIGVTVLSALGKGTVLRSVSKRAGLLSKVAGAILVVAGGYQIYLFLFEFGGLSLLGLA
jgi:cytochrome c-type biogenesis protein